MRQILKKIIYFIIAFLFTVQVCSNHEISKVTASMSTKFDTAEAMLGTAKAKLTITHTIIEKDSSISLSVIQAQESIITWSSDNTDIAIVDEAGVVTGVQKGNTTIVANVVFPDSNNVTQLSCKVGVKTSDYLPETPANDSYLVGKDISAGTYIVFSDKTSLLGAYWEINNITGEKIIDNDFTEKASIITLAKSQRLVIHNGYAIPVRAVSKSIFKLWNLSEVIFLQNIESATGNQRI